MLRRFHRLALIAAGACCGLSASLFAAGPTERAAIQPKAASSSPTQLSEHLSQEIRNRLDYATSLAERGATLSAREESVNALKQIAIVLDSGSASRSRMRILDSSLNSLFENSSTPVESVDESRRRQESYQTAANQLGQVFAGQPLASSALYALGRLESISIPTAGNDSQFAKARAMALFLAAVGSDRGNTAAAHELGTMFATLGQLEQAAYWLESGTKGSAHPETWENLAAVYDRLNQPRQAEAARIEAKRLASEAQSSASSSGITWVDQATFARTAGSDLSSAPRSIERLGGSVRSLEASSASTGRPKETKTAAVRKWTLFSGRKN